MKLTTEALAPLGHLINAVIAFRVRQCAGLIPDEAVPDDPQVRMMDAWLRSLDQLKVAEVQKAGGAS